MAPAQRPYWDKLQCSKTRTASGMQWHETVDLRRRSEQLLMASNATQTVPRRLSSHLTFPGKFVVPIALIAFSATAFIFVPSHFSAAVGIVPVVSLAGYLGRGWPADPYGRGNRPRRFLARDGGGDSGEGATQEQTKET